MGRDVVHYIRQKVTAQMRQEIQDAYADRKEKDPSLTLKQFAMDAALQFSVSASTVRKVIRGYH